MNKTYAVLYLVMTATMSIFVFIFMEKSLSAMLFAAFFLVNVFLFADILRGGR